MTVYQKEYLLKGWHTQQGLVSSTTAGCSLEILRLGQLLSYEAGTEDLKNHWYSVCVGRLKMLMSAKDDRNRVDRCSHQQEVKAGRQAGKSSVIFYLNLFTHGLLGKGVSCSEGGSFVGNHFTNPHRSVHLRGSTFI